MPGLEVSCCVWMPLSEGAFDRGAELDRAELDLDLADRGSSEKSGVAHPIFTVTAESLLSSLSEP